MKYAIVFLIMSTISILSCQNQAAENPFAINIIEKQKGVCWVGSPRPLEGWELDSLSEKGISHISQTPFGWQSDPNAPEINISPLILDQAILPIRNARKYSIT